MPLRVRDLAYLLGSTRLGISVLAVIRDASGQVLLAYSDYKRPFEFSLPGGLLRGDETIEEGLKREVQEELGLEVRIVRALSARRRRVQRLELFYECAPTGGKLRPSDEVSRVEFFDPTENALPPNLDHVHRAVLLALFDCGLQESIEPGPGAEEELRKADFCR